jgi:hypothetical protein
MIINPYVFAAAPTTDPYFSSVKLLCHFDGSNGQTTTVDSSSAAHTLTNVATANLSTAQLKFGTTSGRVSTGGWSSVDSADWYFGSGQFTVESWIYFVNVPATNVTRAIVAQWQTGGQQGWYLAMVNGSLTFGWSTTGSNGIIVASAWSPVANTWYHVSADRDASHNFRLCINGAVVGTTNSNVTLWNSTDPMTIGRAGSALTTMDGYLDDLRITKGVARYAGAFTPPTAAFPDA